MQCSWVSIDAGVSLLPFGRLPFVHEMKCFALLVGGAGGFRREPWGWPKGVGQI